MLNRSKSPHLSCIITHSTWIYNKPLFYVIRKPYYLCLWKHICRQIQGSQVPLYIGKSHPMFHQYYVPIFFSWFRLENNINFSYQAKKHYIIAFNRRYSYFIKLLVPWWVYILILDKIYRIIAPRVVINVCINSLHLLVHAILIWRRRNHIGILVFILTWPRRHFDHLGSSSSSRHIHCTKDCVNNCDYPKCG